MSNKLIKIILIVVLAVIGARAWYRYHNDHLVAASKAYCESLVPIIEKYERDHGHYPDTLQAILGNQGSLPKATEYKSGLPFYVFDRSENFFQIGFFAPDHYRDYGYYYDSRQKEWSMGEMY